MSTSLRPSRPALRVRPLARAAAAVSVLLAASGLFGAPRAEGQNFSVGAGGGFVNDTASAATVQNFSTGSYHLFGEVHLEKNTTLQLRLGSMSLPPSAEGGPNVTAQHGEFLVQYLFDWEWFHAGFIGGGGLVKLKPKSLEEGQVSVDVAENVFSIMGGVVSVFQIVPNWDARVEAEIYLFNSKYADRTPLVLAASVAYSF